LKNISAILLFGISGFALLYSCKKEKHKFDDLPPATTEVNLDLSKVPYNTLSEYNLFEGDLKNMEPLEEVLEYEPASSLFTDYALKKRFIWMPPNVSAKYVSDHELLDMPIGTILVKHFYYDNVQPANERVILETRVMIRKMNGWIFAEYVWNDDQTEAYLDMDGSYRAISWIDYNGNPQSTNYRIPSETECMICHKDNNNPIPIGLKPQNLNFSLDYGSETVNQLSKMISIGFLKSKPSNIVSTVSYKDPSQPLDLRFRSYLDINCAHCHQEGSHCDYRPLRLAFNETGDPQNIGLCVEPDEIIDPAMNFIISPANINRSVMHFRLSATDENVRMPLVGRTLVHEEGVQLLEDWINSRTDCN
jgi:uncharacterized repeat protein (TIGR03806 family)